MISNNRYNIGKKNTYSSNVSTYSSRPSIRLDLPVPSARLRPATLDFAPPCDTGNGEGDGTKVTDLEHSTGFMRLGLFETSVDICRDDLLVEGRDEGREGD